jgi:hypothetical protein
MPRRTTQQQDRVAGFLYLLVALSAPTGLLYVPGNLIVTGDPLLWIPTVPGRRSPSEAPCLPLFLEDAAKLRGNRRRLRGGAGKPPVPQGKAFGAANRSGFPEDRSPSVSQATVAVRLPIMVTTAVDVWALLAETGVTVALP